MFVVFEGIDGSGKTTLSNRVADELRKLGLSVKHLRAGGRLGSAIAERIRDLARDAQNLELAWETEFLLYVAREVQLGHELLGPALSSFDVVIADRYLYTPAVLARHGRRLGAEWVSGVIDSAVRRAEPDLVVLADVDPSLSQMRRRLRKLSRKTPDAPARKGLAGAGLQHRLRRGYLELAARDPERWLVLPNHVALEDSVRSVTALIRSAGEVGAAQALAGFRAESKGVPRSQAGPTDPESALRSFLRKVDDFALTEPGVAALLLRAKYGPVVDERRQALADSAPEALLAGMVGLSDPESFRLRRLLAERFPAAVLRSLRGTLGSSASRQLWQELEALAPAEALSCLVGLDDARAWQARWQYCDDLPAETVASLAGLDGEQAWELRERLRRSSSQRARAYPEQDALARSVTGLCSERAWQVRREAAQSAIVSALASLTGVGDEESWSWRERYSTRAPKIVTKTLHDCTEARAWRMRLALMHDCKEALDGIAGLDDEQAWTLREACYDVWPSTVVKTLGPLAYGARGERLIERQLRAYPDNLALLEHVAGVALGMYRRSTVEA